MRNSVAERVYLVGGSVLVLSSRTAQFAETKEGDGDVVPESPVVEGRSRDELDRFVRENLFALRGFAFANIKDRQSAEDVLSEALLELAERWHTIRTPHRYVMTTLRNKINDHYRRQKRFASEQLPRDAEERESPADTFEATRFRLAFAQLTKDELTVIFLSEFQGLPIEEVAATPHLPARRNRRPRRGGRARRRRFALADRWTRGRPGALGHHGP